MFDKLFKNISILDKYNSETIDILQLIRSENVGIKTFHTLIKLYGSARLALENLPELASRGGKTKALKIYPLKEVENELTSLDKIGAKLITYKANNYPSLLEHICDYPPLMTIIGNEDLLLTNMVAMVGARNASGNGLLFTKQIAKELGKYKYTVVSGLARGIDTAAHQASLASGTVAVIAGGIDHIYPPENQSLYQKIASEGLIIAELAFGSVAKAQHFPRRNRIISGLSMATIVMEATLNSGSLITARFALEQNRELYAVPGFPLDPRAMGTNKLIKEGANIVESVEDLIQNINDNSLLMHGSPSKKNHSDDSLLITNKLNDNSKLYNYTDINNYDESSLKSARNEISSLLSASPIDIDLLLKQSSLDLSVIYIVLLELELAGKLERYPGNKVAFKYEIV